MGGARDPRAGRSAVTAVPAAVSAMASPLASARQGMARSVENPIPNAPRRRVFLSKSFSGAYHRLSCYIISAVYFGSFFILFVKSLRDLVTSSRLITFILGTLHSRCYRTSYVRTAPSAQVSPSPPVQKYSPLSPNSHTLHCSLLPTSARLSADPPLHPSLLRESLKSNHRAGSCCSIGEAIIRSS